MKQLFEPVNIGRLSLKNRIVKVPVQTNLANTDGSVSERNLYHYAGVARGGAGLVIVEGAAVHHTSKTSSPAAILIDSDKYIHGLEELATVIKVNGARAAIQLSHTGRMTRSPDSGVSVSASDVSYGDRISRPLTVSEIQEIGEAFAESALRAKKAGFDAVNVHAHAAYLLGSFLSPFFNRRTDRYGGSLENRVRFPAEVVRRIRSKVGDGYPIMVRISGDEYIEGGIKVEDAGLIARKLAEAGADCIDVCQGIRETQDYMTAPMTRPPGFSVHLAESIKKRVTIPVITQCRINDVSLAESILREGKADLIGMGRALLADPELPRKAAAGSLDDIRKCTGCNEGCIARLQLGLRVRCTVNAAMGREREFAVRQADHPRRVMVIGGGPAGMEAARVAALRGHQVTLYERNGELGGQVALAATPPFREELNNVAAYLSGQVRKLDVQIELNRKVTPGLVKRLKPDVVIVATGSSPLMAEIPGIRRDTVVLGGDVLAGKAEVGKTVVVAGGGLVGSEVAEFLAIQGKKVTIVEMLGEIAADMEPLTRKLLLARLTKHGVSMLTGLKVEEVTSQGVVGVDAKRRERVVKADTVVLCLGAVADDTLADRLRSGTWELYRIGDCVKPRKMIDAIFEGSYIAHQI